MNQLSTRVLERQLQVIKRINKDCIERLGKNWLKKIKHTPNVKAKFTKK